jgi:hypothetical protein
MSTQRRVVYIDVRKVKPKDLQLLRDQVLRSGGVPVNMRFDDEGWPIPMLVLAVLALVAVALVLLR